MSTAAAEDLYAILGVAADASGSDIRRAFRARARDLHPDRNPAPDAADAFAAVQHAYSVLRDDAQRVAYDQHRRTSSAGPSLTGVAAPAGSGAPAAARPATATSAPSSATGSPGAGRGPQRGGGDLTAQVTIAFRDAVFGASTPVPLRYPTPCVPCAGTGQDRAGATRTCPLCEGLGMNVATGATCAMCHGAQRVSDTPCPSCRGVGHAVAERVKHVQLPAGVRDGQVVRLAHQGAPGPGGGQAGHLHVTVAVEPHPVFQRSGEHDLGLYLPVRWSELVAGASVDVPLLDGPAATVKVPAGAQPGALLRVPGRGVPKPDGGRGDLVVCLQVVVPTVLSGAEQAAVGTLIQAERQYGANPREAMLRATG